MTNDRTGGAVVVVANDVQATSNGTDKRENREQDLTVGLLARRYPARRETRQPTPSTCQRDPSLTHPTAFISCGVIQMVFPKVEDAVSIG